MEESNRVPIKGGNGVKRKILITGGNGFIGRYLCRELDRMENDILVVDNVLAAPDFPWKNKRANISEPEEIEAVLAEYQPNIIVHLAAIASPVYRDTAEIYRVNVVGTENLLKGAAKLLPAGSRVILLSTAGVYGNQTEKRLHERLPFNPINHYSYSKMIVEVLSRQYQDRLDICIVRPFNIVGIGQNKNFLLPKLVYHFKNRIPVLEIGNLAAVRDYVSVEFCAEVLSELCTAENTPPIINICSGIGHSCQEVIDLLGKISGFMPEVVPVANFIRPNEIWSLIGDDTVLRTVTQGRYYTQPLHNILEGMLAQ